MTQVIDRRKNGRGKSTENRQKFIRRAKEVVKEQLDDLIISKKMKELGKSGGVIDVPRSRRLNEPSYRNGAGGHRDYVLPGNKKFSPGDRIWKPKSNSGEGGAGSEGHSTAVELSERELLDIIFDDLELPNLVKQELAKVKSNIKKHNGYNRDGAPNKLSVIRSLRQSFMRTIPIEESLEEELANARRNYADAECHDLHTEMSFWLKEIARIGKEIEEIPFLDPLDLRYKQTTVIEEPSTHATMIMIMDNSGSMEDADRVMAKRFFALLYRFLSLHYDQIDLLFISHTTEARFMSEEEFFSTGDSGGTIVSSALELAKKKINEVRGKTNIYVCQVSDGDNWHQDDPVCKDLLVESIMPLVQYYAYIQIDDYHSTDEDNTTVRSYLGIDKGLWRMFEEVSKTFKNFQMRRVFEPSDIFPVFRELFKRKGIEG